MIIERDLTHKIQRYLDQDEILLLIGARQAGKTTLLHQIEDGLKKQERPCHFLNLEDPDYLSLLNASPKNLLKIFPFNLQQQTFVLVDEIQYLKNPSNFLKYFYDEYHGKIKIIASGSSAFYLDKKFQDSLAGRKRIFYVLTLSFREFLRFKQETALAQADFDTLSLSEKEKIDLYYYEYLIYGGYPRVVLAPLSSKEEILADLTYSYIKKDVLEANIRQDEAFFKLFKILAGQVGNLVNTSELAATLSLSKTAIENYLYVMQKSFHLRLIRPFSKNIRKELTKMPKVYFLDLGLRNFLVRNFASYEQRADRGSLLENAVYRELLGKYDFEEIRFWRTSAKNEIDFLVGERAALEVKAEVKKVKISKYKTFFQAYPNIQFYLASLNPSVKKIGQHPILEAWNLSLAV